MGVGEIPRRGRQPSSGTPENTTTMKSQALEAEKLQSLRCVENLERERGGGCRRRLRKLYSKGVAGRKVCSAGSKAGEKRLGEAIKHPLALATRGQSGLRGAGV